MEGTTTYQTTGFSPTMQHSQHHVSSSSRPATPINLNTTPSSQAASPASQNYGLNGNTSPATSRPGFLNQHLLPTTFGTGNTGVAMSGVRPPTTSATGFGQNNFIMDGHNVSTDMIGLQQGNKLQEPVPLIDPALAFQKTLRADPQFTSYFENLQTGGNVSSPLCTNRSTAIEEKMFQIFKQQMGYDASNQIQKSVLSTTNNMQQGGTDVVGLTSTPPSNQVGPHPVCNNLDSNVVVKKEAEANNSWGATLPPIAIMAGIGLKKANTDVDDGCHGKKKRRKVEKLLHLNRPDIPGFCDGNVNGIGLVAAAAAVVQRTSADISVPLLHPSSDVSPNNSHALFSNSYPNFHETILAANSISDNKPRQNQDGPVSCDICGIMCTNNFGLSLHKKSHIDQVSFRCRECSFATGTVTQLRLHEKYVHNSTDNSPVGVEYQQNNIGLGTSGSSNMNFNPPPIEQKPTMMDTSLMSDKPSANYPFQCTVCDGAFRRKQDLTRHLQVHKTAHKCSACQEGFATKQKLTAHTAENHRTGMFNCYQCLAQFTHPVHLQLHLNICNQSTTTAIQKRWKNVEQTEPEDNKDKRNVCNVCGKGFKMVHYLKSHMRTHTGERPFSCHICFKSFSQRSTLKVHNRIHTGEKPYQCSMCTKAFSVRLYLQAHVRTHTGERPYKCSICNRSFSQRSSLVTHTKRHDGF